MNIIAVGSTPPPPPVLPAVTGVAPATSTSTSTSTMSGHAEERPGQDHARQSRRATRAGAPPRPALPPVKVLTLHEMRAILGMPAPAPVVPQQQSVSLDSGSTFDAYA
jgi:hypothetical protein